MIQRGLHACVWLFTADRQMLSEGKGSFHVFIAPEHASRASSSSDKIKYRGRFRAHRLGVFMPGQAWQQLPVEVRTCYGRRLEDVR